MYLALLDLFGEELIVPGYVRCDLSKIHWKLSPGISDDFLLTFVNADEVCFQPLQGHQIVPIVALRVCPDVIGFEGASVPVPLNAPICGVCIGECVAMKPGGIRIETTIGRLQEGRNKPRPRPIHEPEVSGAKRKPWLEGWGF